MKYRVIDVPLQGLGEAVNAAARPPGTLDIVFNLETREANGLYILCKTKGYQHINMHIPFSRYPVDSMFTHLAEHHGRLLIFSYDYITELADRNGLIADDSAVVYRGPSNRGNASLKMLAVARASRNS